MLKLIKKHLKNEKGLTLIELLVVIVILGIIAAIAVVSIGGIIGKTKDKATVTEAVQIINAAKLAHSTEGDASSWNNDALKEYVNNLKDEDWTVELTEGVYSIKGHNASDVIEDNPETISEKILTDYLGGEAPASSSDEDDDTTTGDGE